jgi:threonyl-tRNA synthetase
VERETLDLLAREGASCADLANRLQKGDVDGYLLKPMNCPHHIKIYASQPRSYRDLPVRLAEFGTVYRWEQSGELGGLTRVRGFTQDDAHLFCTEEQVPAEILGCLSLVKIILTTLGMSDYRVRVGLRDPDSAKYTGDAANWDKAEAACREAVRTLGVSYTEEPGEAAFYGPKIDFIVRDVIGREWQLGTVQVDYNLPERFDLSYIGADNQPHRPVMIHRAPFGSMERFFGILIEHFAGAFPAWLAPLKAVVVPVAPTFNDYATKVERYFEERQVHVVADLSDQRMNAKIRNAQSQKTPYMLVVGGKEQESDSVSIRSREGEQRNGVPLAEAFAFIQEKITSKALK